MSKYFLQPHIFMCVTEYGGFFLDEKVDRYIGISFNEMQALSTVLHGVQSNSDDVCFNDPIALNLARDLEGTGVLTVNASVGKMVKPVMIQKCNREVKTSGLKSKTSFRDTRRFFASVGLTALKMRRNTHAQIMHSLHVEKEVSGCMQNEDAVQSAYELTRVFRRLRPFAYTSKDKCLFDCLTLMHFLLCYGIRPTMVFGIRPRPFLAHCWVQIEQLALSCSAEYTRSFTPIRTI